MEISKHIALIVKKALVRFIKNEIEIGMQWYRNLYNKEMSLH